MWTCSHTHQTVEESLRCGNEWLARLHMMVRVLIRRDHRTFVPIVIVVVRFNEAVLRKLPLLAVIQELLVRPEKFRLMLQQIHNLHGRTGLIEVIQLRRVLRSRPDQPVVNTQVRLIDVKQIHPDLAKRSSIVRKRSIANRRPRNR